ncbi:CPBP family intramembrane glutamic endopeptidase [Granulicella sp. L60]|uniref:CPBP family intramembrane glutamic endopeptidase n=1 Tax=Granulicella sp. L60 TaxID=1641866 RepID=UPI00131B7F0A
MNESVQTDNLGNGRQTVVFLSATLLLSAPWWVLLAKYKMQGHWPLVLGLMCSPGLAGLLTSRVCRVPMRRFGWRWPKWKWVAAGYFIPIGYSLLAYSFIWITGLGTPHEAFIRGPGQPTGWGLIWWVHILTYIPMSALPVVLGVFGGGTLGALGEEIGWSGFLVPALARRFGFTATSLISGAIWAVWHVPFLLYGGYHGDAPLWYSFLCFATMVIAMRFLWVWVRLRSGSLWPCVLLHATHNFWIQTVLTPRTADSGHTRWWIDEFGAALAIVTLLMAAFICWRQRNLLGKALLADTTDGPIQPSYVL